jgi:hypothetical protein
MKQGRTRSQTACATEDGHVRFAGEVKAHPLKASILQSAAIVSSKMNFIN